MDAIGHIIPAFFIVIYFGAIIAVVVYIIRLLTRLVKAVEKIADKLDSPPQPKEL